jgi:tetratricopeptide (TPR) repeat protein
MARKRRKGPVRKLKAPSQRAQKRDRLADIPDRRATEKVLQGFLNIVSGADEGSPLDEAKELMYEAFETSDADEQIRLAREAIEISPDCADAFVLLAEHARNTREALELYQQAIAAGERAIGADAYEENIGHFWAVLETRPYMRARMGLAQVLWGVGRRDEAIDHVQQMLRLNPNDNQGVRYILACWLLAEGRDDELAALLARFDELSATWAYSKALAAFRRNGDSPEAQKLLTIAMKVNRYVPAYLLEQEPLPTDRPGMYSRGSEEEAVLYAGEAMGGWKTSSGAIAWLRARQPGAKKGRSSELEARGPTAAEKSRLRRLPQVSETWQADIRQFGPVVAEDGVKFQPWFFLVTSPGDDLVIAQGLARAAPPASWIWNQLSRAMSKPITKKPRRPTIVEVLPGESWRELEPHLAEIGVKLMHADSIDHLDSMLEELDRHLRPETPPGLHQTPGIEPEEVVGYYQAAAEFYRKAPWRKVADHTAIKVECKSLEGGPWYAVVMGQGGMTFGLTLYDDPNVLRRTWLSRASDEKNALETIALTVIYDDEACLTAADREFVEEYDCEIAGLQACPMIFRKERGMNMRDPLAWELRLMTACLCLVPAFLASHGLDDPDAKDVSVRLSADGLEFVLSWIED